jgi:hypothetical protein
MNTRKSHFFMSSLFVLITGAQHAERRRSRKPINQQNIERLDEEHLWRASKNKIGAIKIGPKPRESTGDAGSTIRFIWRHKITLHFAQYHERLH